MVTVSPLYGIVLEYCGAAGVSDEAFPPDEEAVPEDEDPDTEPLFEEDDVLESESLFEEDDVLKTELIIDEDEEVFDLTTGSFSPNVEESFVAGTPLSSAAAGIALYNGESTITAARINVSSFAFVFFMLLLLLHRKGFYCIIKRPVSGKTERTQQNCFLWIISCPSNEFRHDHKNRSGDNTVNT